MATSLSYASSFLIQFQPKGLPPPPQHLNSSTAKPSLHFSEKFKYFTKRIPSKGIIRAECKACLAFTAPAIVELPPPSVDPFHMESLAYINIEETSSKMQQGLVLIDLDPATAKLAIAFLGPFLSAFAFLFIVRIVMSWYPKLPVEKFPYVLAYAPTEPILIPTRKVIPPLGGVDVTPVVWFGLVSFLNEILVGPQGLLVLLSQQV